MATGLFALLDDIAAIARLSAASLDDIGAAAGKAGAKAAGVVIDDTAVTPRFVMGLAPERELPIIARIARGSLFNKLVLLLPAALLLSWLLPGAITPLLMLGGAYLAFEATEKVGEALHFISQHAEETQETVNNAAELERQTIAGAVRTDFILSAEIMAIALASIEVTEVWTRAAVLAVVAVGITVGVYGMVGLIVKADDVGLVLARRDNGVAKSLGRFLIKAMPRLLAALEVIGTAAMLWVGGGIVLHGLEELIPAVHHANELLMEPITTSLGNLAGWGAQALLSAVLGLVIGVPLVAVVLGWQRRRG